MPTTSYTGAELRWRQNNVNGSRMNLGCIMPQDNICNIGTTKEGLGQQDQAATGRTQRVLGQLNRDEYNSTSCHQIWQWVM
jgi:hypothetical protein